jgi:enamine deaminase RidA (YjgF/YER057c/UK114 family)
LRHCIRWRPPLILSIAGVAYLAGQVPDGAAADSADIRVQTASVLEQIDTLLARCGSAKDRILRAQIYLVRGET